MATVPRYHKLKLLLKEKIVGGEFKVGDRFFSQTELIKKYGLSFATVTHALKELEGEGYLVRVQGKGTFVKSTEKILAAVPGSTSLVFVFIPWDARVPNQGNYATMYRAMEETRPLHIEMKLIPYSSRPDDLESFLFSREAVAGAVFVYPEDVHLSLIEGFARDHPTVVVGREMQNPDIGCVWTDNGKAAEQVVQHLADQGHSKIGMVCGPLTAPDARDRLDGYRKTLRANRLVNDDSLVTYTNDIDTNGYCVSCDLLEKNPDMTAVFAAGDAIAMGIYAAANTMGRAIPSRLSVVGFDDTYFSAEMKPPLTTVHVPYDEMARRAVEVLSNLIQTGNAERDCVVSYLKTRDSSGPVQG